MNHKTKWLLNAILFTGFIAAFFLDWTGVSLHQWIGVGIGLFAAYHMALHWDWIGVSTRRLLKKTSGRLRTFYLVDTALMIGFLLIGSTGLMISTWLNLPLANYAGWLTTHIAISILTLVVLIVKIGLHRRWITTQLKKFVTPAFPLREQSATGGALAIRADGVEKAVNRREFLKVMGTVSLLSIFALGKSLQSLQSASVSQDTDTALEGQTAAVSQQSASTGATNANSCSIQCSRQCSFPGHCRRYRDTNGNNLCDLGECA